MDDTNPYASPLSMEPEAPAATDSEPTEVTAWREGDVLVAPGRNAVVPRACALTNASRGVWPYLLVESRLWEELLLALILLIPFAGLVVAGFSSLVMIELARFAQVRLWVRRPFALLRHGCETVVMILMLASNVLTGVGLIRQDGLLIVLGLAAYAAALPIVYVVPRAFIRFRPTFGKDGLVRVYHVHPGYLDRLPESRGEEAKG